MVLLYKDCDKYNYTDIGIATLEASKNIACLITNGKILDYMIVCKITVSIDSLKFQHPNIIIRHP